MSKMLYGMTVILKTNVPFLPMQSSNGNTVTGTIAGKPGEPTYKIVDGVVRGNRIHFFVLHEDENDPEVKANEGKPFHDLAQGTFTDDEIVVSGSRENTKIREYRLVLKRIRK